MPDQIREVDVLALHRAQVVAHEGQVIIPISEVVEGRGQCQGLRAQGYLAGNPLQCVGKPQQRLSGSGKAAQDGEPSFPQPVRSAARTPVATHAVGHVLAKVDGQVS